MKNKKALHIGLFAALSAIVAAPSMAELRQECLFTGEVLQKQADAPIQIRFTGINDGENARCKAKGEGLRRREGGGRRGSGAVLRLPFPSPRFFFARFLPGRNLPTAVLVL